MHRSEGVESLVRLPLHREHHVQHAEKVSSDSNNWTRDRYVRDPTAGEVLVPWLSPTDPLAFLSVVALLAAVAMAATIRPALRYARTP